MRELIYKLIYGFDFFEDNFIDYSEYNYDNKIKNEYDFCRFWFRDFIDAYEYENIYKGKTESRDKTEPQAIRRPYREPFIDIWVKYLFNESFYDWLIHQPKKHQLELLKILIHRLCDIYVNYITFYDGDRVFPKTKLQKYHEEHYTHTSRPNKLRLLMFVDLYLKLSMEFDSRYREYNLRTLYEYLFINQIFPNNNSNYVIDGLNFHDNDIPKHKRKYFNMYLSNYKNVKWESIDRY